MKMEISERGIALVKRFEGLRTMSYQCPAGVWTIGYGCTTDVAPGMKITEAQAEQRLKDDLHDAEKCVNNAVTVPLTQPEFDALCSFVFNLGCGAFRGSTLLKLLNNSDYDGACVQFTKWVKVAGKESAGLVARRAAEAELFEGMA